MVILNNIDNKQYNDPLTIGLRAICLHRKPEGDSPKENPFRRWRQTSEGDLISICHDPSDCGHGVASPDSATADLRRLGGFSQAKTLYKEPSRPAGLL